MKVCHVIGSVSRLGGGVSEALVGLTNSLAHTDVRSMILTREDPFLAEDRTRIHETPIVACGVTGPKRFPITKGLYGALERAKPDVVHLHGIWSSHDFAVRRYCRSSGTPYVVSPHGMLDPWILTKSRLLKRTMYYINERSLLSRANLLHALSPSEEASVRRLNLPSPLKTIPNGVSLLDRYEDNAAAKRKLPEAPLRFIYLGRLDPKKNVHGLLEAWRLFAMRHEHATLTLAGWGPEGYIQALTEVARSKVGPLRVSFAGPLYGESKRHFLRDAHFLVLPSFSEGFPMVPLESWAQGTPTILSEYCNMDFAFSEGLALHTGTEPTEIASALEEAALLSCEARSRMGANGYNKVATSYSWNAIAEQWANEYVRLQSLS